MSLVIILPNGKQCSLNRYVYGWKACKRLVKEGRGSSLVAGFGDWPESAARILSAIRYGVDDRVNIRGGFVVRDVDPLKYLLKRIRSGRIVRQCKWCGQKFTAQFMAQRCCDAQCEIAYMG